MTPKMKEALDKLAATGSLPKSHFHHSTVTALLKGGHVEEVPGDSTWIALVAVRSGDLPQRDPAVPVIPIDDEVIGAGRHVDVISTVATPKAWVRGCSSCKMPMVENPAHLPGCEVALVQEVLSDQGLPPVALNVEQREDAESVAGVAAKGDPVRAAIRGMMSAVPPAVVDAEAPTWRCRNRVKATRVSRRRAQRGAMAR